jgi:outer membrane beta-barrel protein
MRDLMKHLLVMWMIPAATAWAAAADAPIRFAQAQSPSPSKPGSDDDEDEETPVKPPEPEIKRPVVAPQTPAGGPTASPQGQVAPATPLAKPPSDVPAAETVRPEAQRLVSGAPLFDPNVAVHTVERKQFSDRGRWEAVLYPVVPQINGKFTQHDGTAAMLVYHLQENFAFQITPQYNWYASETSFNQELINKVREQAEAATSLLLNWGVQGGVEVTPLYGKFAFYQGTLGHFSFVLNAGAGVGDTSLQLRTANSAGPATFGDAGLKFLGSVGGGFRVLLGDRFAVRLEVRDVVYTARVDSVDGCNANDLGALYQWFQNQQGTSITTVPVSGGCNVKRFTGADPKTGYTYVSDIPLANNLVATPSSDVLNNVGFYLGLSLLF